MSIRIPVVTPDGEYVMHVSETYAAKALARGEVARTDSDVLAIIPQPINELDGETKRRLRLAKERKNNR